MCASPSPPLGTRHSQLAFAASLDLESTLATDAARAFAERANLKPDLFAQLAYAAVAKHPRVIEACQALLNNTADSVDLSDAPLGAAGGAAVAYLLSLNTSCKKLEYVARAATPGAAEHRRLHSPALPQPEPHGAQGSCHRRGGRGSQDKLHVDFARVRRRRILGLRRLPASGCAEGDRPQP